MDVWVDPAGLSRVSNTCDGSSGGDFCGVVAGGDLRRGRRRRHRVDVDQANHPVAGVRVQLKSGENAAAAADTDQAGHADFKGLPPGRYQITANKEGFEPLVKGDLDFSQAGASMELTLIPVLAQRDSVEVIGEAPPVEEGASTSNAIGGQDAKMLPTRPATVADALPLIPGVARSPGGGLQISGGGEHRSSLIVNSADVTDPATGQFGLTVPIDSVETLNVFQTPFLAEYGRFTAGLVSVETRRGGDKWKWELNDPLPEFFIRSWRLRGLRDATPRLNFEGPLVPGKLYFSEGLEYEVRKTPVFTLPFPYNLKRKQGINSFAQFDWVTSDKNLLTLTVHVAPQRLEHVNMDYFNPEPTTPDAGTHNYTATIARPPYPGRPARQHGFLNQVRRQRLGPGPAGPGDGAAGQHGRLLRRGRTAQHRARMALGLLALRR